MAIWQGNCFLGGLLLLKNYSLIFATQLGEIFNHIFCHTYSNLIVLRGVETDGIILLVENSVLSYTCGGLQ